MLEWHYSKLTAILAADKLPGEKENTMIMRVMLSLVIALICTGAVQAGYFEDGAAAAGLRNAFVSTKEIMN
jgi:hypothetical protein